MRPTEQQMLIIAQNQSTVAKDLTDLSIRIKIKKGEKVDNLNILNTYKWFRKELIKDFNKINNIKDE